MLRTIKERLGVVHYTHMEDGEDDIWMVEDQCTSPYCKGGHAKQRHGSGCKYYEATYDIIDKKVTISYWKSIVYVLEHWGDCVASPES